MVKAKKFILHKRPEGLPKSTDFKLVEVELPPLKDNEFLAEAVYLSVDPYMRYCISTLPLESTMIGIQVAKIIESRNPKYPVGKYVVGPYGWRTHTITEGDDTNSMIKLVVLPDLGDLPLSLGLGVLGMPGITAYFGFLEICLPKIGETVVVSGAAGAVGSHVGQIAKIKGCKVIGIAGTDEKGKWLTKELGFDHFINYKTQNVGDELKKVAPDGVDAYFDNVGGEISITVMDQMKMFGRIAVCGAISSYNQKETPKVQFPYMALVFQQLKMEGLHVTRWNDRWMEGVNQNLQWIQQGKLKYKETVTEGFQNIVNAFVGMLSGGNIGKAIVKV